MKPRRETRAHALPPFSGEGECVDRSAVGVGMAGSDGV